MRGMMWGFRRKFSPHTRGCSAAHVVVVSVLPVFPAYAGMFRRRFGGCQAGFGFPRIRGDVPSAFRRVSSRIRFSPHTRGCSAEAAAAAGGVCVFPAYAGMFRITRAEGMAHHRFPRIRGDVPLALHILRKLVEFSPHTRGCSAAISLGDSGMIVFPAYAGMFRVGSSTIRSIGRFPRIRGDVPNQSFVPTNHTWFSPHTRGCSALNILAPMFGPVFPAYAGMFRC